MLNDGGSAEDEVIGVEGDVVGGFAAPFFNKCLYFFGSVVVDVSIVVEVEFTGDGKYVCFVTVPD